MNDLTDIVTQLFAFLVAKYGFQLKAGRRESSLDSIVYEKKPVTIEFGWYKGEIDISFHVDLDNDLFRPHLSRTFHLSQIALRQDKHAIRTPPGSRTTSRLLPTPGRGSNSRRGS